MYSMLVYLLVLLLSTLTSALPTDPANPISGGVLSGISALAIE